jgi:signal transduction histidine kinase
LNDASQEGNFIRTSYIVKQQPKSILCTPLLNQGKLVGILYLENNLTTGAFTPDRLEVLKLLSSQAAISIENAKLYAQVRESERRLTQFNEFISILSHELRTPLTAIRGFLGLLNTSIYDNKPEKAKRMIQQALTNSDRLVHLVNDILDLERLSSGRVQLAKEVCNAEDLMQRSVEGVQSIALGAAITLSIIPSNARVWASPDSIIQTLTNLLSNAIKFSFPNSVITLSAQLQTDSVLFQVKDQGRGIPADKLETIFERFQQVDISDSPQKQGTGLGLAICQTLVQQHDGSIWAESMLGEGSTFYFTLPIHQENHD